MSQTDLIRLMLVDDHPIVLSGLRNVLEASGRFDIVAQALDGAEAVRVALAVKPEVIIMDVVMPEKDGIDACREIMEILPDTRVLVLTALTEEDAVIQAIAAGAAGFVQKYSPPEELLEAVQALSEGRLRVPDHVIRRVFEMLRNGRIPQSRQPHDSLTQLEQEVLKMFAAGWSYAQIAEARSNSPVTVRNTLYRIQNKLGIATKQELIIWAVRSGLLDDFTVDAE